MTGLHDDLCSVGRDVCRACVSAAMNDLLRQHPVLPSLVYQSCDQALSRDSYSAAGTERLECLRKWSEKAIVAQGARRRDHVPACDVILSCRDCGAQTKAAIESILAQEDAVVIAHLLDRGRAGELLAQYADHWNVRLHKVAAGISSLAATHSLVERLETPFIALQTEGSLSHPRRIADSVTQLMDEGGEILAAALISDTGLIAAALPETQGASAAVPIPTLVFRRATFVDMGGVAAASENDEADFVRRAVSEARRIVIRSQPTVSLRQHPEDLPRLVWTGSAHWKKSPARGFRQEPVECDVVLPFRGQLDYVKQALESVLAQEAAEVVVHLVDDASPDDASGFLRFWKGHPRVRTYRNRRNIGQFTSFNNVSPYFETGLVAVQDADDISLPHRLATAGAMLRLSDSDFFGAGVELFGDTHSVRPVFVETDQLQRRQRAEYRQSFYPRFEQISYFLENPTAVFRVSMFREMGGYADFGDRLTNRASLDTEFLLRCLFSGVRFAISRDVVTRYRVHTQSATQNSSTGWGTHARAKASAHVEFRSRLYRQGQFDPRVFGSLGRHRNLTERI